MKIRCLTEYDKDVKQWVALSLEFGLGAQADTEIEAKQRLMAHKRIILKRRKVMITGLSVKPLLSLMFSITG